MALILDGKETAAALSARLRERLGALSEKGKTPGLAILLAGDSKPALMYAAFMKKTAESYGISVTVTKKDGAVSEEELLKTIRRLNEDASVTGILMMMPLPMQISADRAIGTIAPEKDVDGLTAANLGRLMTGKDGFFPATPRACMEILSHYGIDPDGKRAVVIGRSTVVGNPAAQLLQRANATVTVCHSHTKGLASVTREADILVAALGKPGSVTADMVKPGAVVLDVGINRVEGKTVGDVDYEAVKEIAGAITPVPGGVGSVTTAMIIEALVSAKEREN